MPSTIINCDCEFKISYKFDIIHKIIYTQYVQ